jgi:hypothetical protein
MKRDNSTIITEFITLAVFTTTGYLWLNGNFATSVVASALIVILVMGAAHYFSRKGLEYNLNPITWLVAAPVFFALVGFGVWAGCVGGTYLLNSMVHAAPTVDFLELVSGIISRGILYAQAGLLIGTFWAMPTSLLIFFYHKKEAQNLSEMVFPKNSSDLQGKVAV